MSNQLEIKKKLIGRIMDRTRSAAILANKHFNAGDLFFTLAFRSVDELQNIAKKIDA